LVGKVANVRRQQTKAAAVKRIARHLLSDINQFFATIVVDRR